MRVGEPAGATETFDVPLAGRSLEWSFCMLVWTRFVEEASLDASAREKWLDCLQSPSQGKMLTLLDTILSAPATAHPLWSRDEFRQLGCTKEFAAAMYVTDRMVKRELKAHPASERAWEQDIVKGWFKSRGGSEARKHPRISFSSGPIASCGSTWSSACASCRTW